MDLLEGTFKITASSIHSKTNFTNTQFSRTITRCLHSLVMVGIDTHFILLKVEGVLAGVNSSQLMVTVKVRPSPQAAIDDMGQALTMGHLKTTIQ